MLRPATEQDCEWIAAIMPQWKPNPTTWVLDRKAFAVWQIVLDECELLYIAVDQAERGKGFAKMLMEYCHRELAALGAKSFFLEVRKSNAVAIALYKKLGYAQIAERKKYYMDGEDAMIMKFSTIPLASAQ
ncbi:MAG: ribosomal protein S18-alanine N-acetyltransferase [Fibromonadales bacterium]|nr:ribosomal protein S18-alanine N-acetyltransferase [Fibromonadales bacterium]